MHQRQRRGLAQRFEVFGGLLAILESIRIKLRNRRLDLSGQFLVRFEIVLENLIGNLRIGGEQRLLLKIAQDRDDEFLRLPRIL